MLGHAYIPTPVLDRRLKARVVDEIRNSKRLTEKISKLEKQLERELTFLEKVELFVREAPTDVSSPSRQLLKVWLNDVVLQ